MKTCVLLLALVANSGAAFAANERATRVAARLPVPATQQRNATESSQ